MNFYITTPIYYANDRLHIGHGYTTITADILARFHRLAGEETFFLTGMDEHGSKIEETAKNLGKTPQQLCDENHKLFIDAFKTLGITNDYFIRTTSDRHKKGVQKMLSKLYDAKTPDGQSVIYKGTYEGLYCVGCEKFITEKELQDGLCPIHLTEPNKVSEENYFFRLSAYLDEIEELIQSDKIKIRPVGRRNEVLGLIKQKLDDFSISREKVTWGIELPFDPSQKAYVWADALSNYITAIGYGDDPDTFNKWWNDSVIVHLMAKDILKFHAIFWPAMLLALGEKVPETLFIHGYLSLDGQKISKSLGNAIANERLVNDFGRDAARFLLVSQFPFHQDGDINYKRLYEKYNSDLANDYGNLVSRVVKMVMVNFDGVIPPLTEDVDDNSDDLLKSFAETPEQAMERIRAIDVLGAIEVIWKLIRTANRYFDHNKPWELAKKGETDKLATVLYRALNAIRLTATLTVPIMPEKSQEVLTILGFGKDYKPALTDLNNNNYLVSGNKLIKAENVFPRLKIPKDTSVVEDQKDDSSDEGIITIDQFFKTKLCVADILTCEKVEKADKLLKLKISIGSEERQIVAGIAMYYSPDQLIGKKIVTVANLKKTKIRGIESQGMLLAAKKGKKLSLVTVDSDIEAGAEIG